MNGREWTDNDLRILREEYPTANLRELSERFGRTVAAIKTRAKKLKVGRNDSAWKVWAGDRKKILIELYPNNSNMKIALVLGLSEMSIAAAGFKFGLSKSKEFMRVCSIKGQFKSGHISHNKGKKQTEYMSLAAIERSKKTRFKKGDVPHNARDIGYTRIDENGYVLIKIEGNRKLVFKHRYVWEQAYGAIQKGYNIVFKDGNPHNCVLENLECISNAELGERNRVTKYPKELRTAIILNNKLLKKVKNYGKEQNHRFKRSSVCRVGAAE